MAPRMSLGLSTLLALGLVLLLLPCQVHAFGAGSTLHSIFFRNICSY